MNLEELKNRIVEKFMISGEMKKYLHTVELTDWQLLSVIAGSLESLEVKLEWIKQLNETCGNKYWEKYYRLQAAIDELYSDDALFLVTMKWMDTDIMEEKRGSTEPFSSFEEVKKYIEKNLYEDFNYPEIQPEDDSGWYEVEKWKKVEGHFIRTYTYYMAGTKAIYFVNDTRKELKTRDPVYVDCDNGQRRGKNLFLRYDNIFCDSVNLNIPVPFDKGDMVAIDCRPAYQRKPALILTRGDNRDCCSLQALTIGEDGEYIQGSVKHASLFSFSPMGHFGISPLYRLETWKEEYSGDKEYLLKRMSSDMEDTYE